MKRAVLASLALSACSSPVASSVAQLLSPTNVAQVGRNMLVVDADRAQARALFLGEKEDFLPQIVRAPNPVYPLSIPSAPYPNAVAAFTAADGTSTLPFAFMLSTAASQVTVVGGVDGKAGFLARLGEFQVPDTTLAIAVQPCVTATCQVCPTKSCTPELLVAEPTHVVLAVSQPSGAALYTASFESTFVPAGLGSVTLRRILELGPNSRPIALAFSPSPSSRNVLAVADSNTGDDGLGRTGSLAVVDLSDDLTSGTVARYDVGGPLKAITIEATGSRLFGVVDAPLCGTVIPCSSLVGFELGTRQLLSPVVQISGSGRGIAASGSDQSGVKVTVTLSDGTTAPEAVVAPLVAVTSTDDSVQFFDGATMASLLSVPITTTSLILTMPGSIAWDRTQKSFFAAYQGGSALVELKAANVRAANSTAGVAIYR